MDVARTLTGAAVGAVALAGAGRNSRVFKVTSDEGPFAMKSYPPVAADGRDRLGTEYAALTFLHAAGQCATPRPLARKDETRVALYEWIEGQTIDMPCDRDIEEAVEFVKHLYRVSRAAEAADISNATESCLSAKEIFRQVEGRLNRLVQVAEDHHRLQTFLALEIEPAFQQCTKQLVDGYAQSSLEVDTEILPSIRILSPSDFGFHNALRRPDGSLYFVDFEYFGWDDPVRLVCDFLLHPGMTLSAHHRRLFRDAMLDIFLDDNDFSSRIRFLYPLVVLRWCMILLNEFLPEKWAARASSENADAIEAAQTKQLEKARTMLGHLDEPLVKLDHAQ